VTDRLLPLFPLDAVLFPGTAMPLLIFEPRYRAMLQDCLAGERAFVLLPSGPGDGTPTTGTIGCIAHVIVHQPLPDGRSQILVRGGERVILRRLEPSETPYLVGRLTPFGDAEGENDLTRDQADELRRLAARCRTALQTLGEQADDTPWSEDPAELTFMLAATIPWAPDQARPFLAMRSAAVRAAALLKVLPILVPDLEARAAVHGRAKRNGHGHHPPEGEAT
jgi:Lon protease-like protein